LTLLPRRRWDPRIRCNGSAQPLNPKPETLNQMGSEDKMWAEMLAYTEEEESIFLRVQKEATAAVRGIP